MILAITNLVSGQSKWCVSIDTEKIYILTWFQGENRTTVDTKPEKLLLTKANLPHRSGSVQAQSVQISQNLPAAAAPSNPPPAQASAEEIKPPENYPDPITWCQYLDSHSARNQDGITFKPLGVLLKQKGFVRISLLTSGLVDVMNLHTWLGIEVGTAILILQYAKADMIAINAGTLFFPPRLDNST
jgi:hypothetical protein